MFDVIERKMLAVNVEAVSVEHPGGTQHAAETRDLCFSSEKQRPGVVEVEPVGEGLVVCKGIGTDGLEMRNVAGEIAGAGAESLEPIVLESGLHFAREPDNAPVCEIVTRKSNS